MVVVLKEEAVKPEKEEVGGGVGGDVVDAQ